MSDERNNTGDFNSGNCNTGDFNSGHRNSGHRNSGHRNSGHFNSGDFNSGDCNSGNRNSGNRNSGNSGNFNSGDWNSGNRNSGFFCTETPKPVFFDRPCGLTWDEAYDAVPCIDLPIGCTWVPESGMTEQEKAEHPNYVTVGGYLKKHNLPYKDAFRQAWERLDGDTRQRFLDLPNFDADKFLEITGVAVREDKPSPDKTTVIDGVKYRLVPVEKGGE